MAMRTIEMTWLKFAFIGRDDGRGWSMVGRLVVRGEGEQVVDFYAGGRD
jgi:hypothetical protein